MICERLMNFGCRSSGQIGESTLPVGWGVEKTGIKNYNSAAGQTWPNHSIPPLPEPTSNPRNDHPPAHPVD